MLVELSIKKMALIEEVTLSFGPGLNVITGETGAGKSLLVGALELLLGERPRPGLVRAGSRQLSVEGRFVVPAGEHRVRRWLERHMPEVLADWEEDEGGEHELVIGRSVTDDGKSRAYVNHRPATLKVLRDLAARLVEIHGQNDHQRLLEPAEQLHLLDTFGGLSKELEGYRAARERWLELVERHERLAREEAERRDRLDLARFQCAEIAAAKPDVAERTSLASERDLLRHADRLRASLGGLVDELCESEGALLSRLQAVSRKLELEARDIGALSEPREAVEQSLIHLEEASRVLRTIAEKVEPDPARLEAIEERLAELERLEHKYKVDIAGLVAHGEALRAEVARLEGDERALADLAPEIGAARAELLRHGGELRRARKSLAAKLKRAVAKNLADLGLERALFDLRIGQRAEASEEPADREDPTAGRSKADPIPEEAGDAEHETPRAHALESIAEDRARFGERGMDRIEFLLAANPGEGLARLRDVASGGETARIMLALRSVLAGADRDRTLVFDEIDAGVGGRLGPAVGAHLERIGAKNQVLCVTHLPAIAAVAKRHLRVAKSVRAGRTETKVEELSGEPRIDEIADMIAGGSAHATARAEARRLLKR